MRVTASARQHRSTKIKDCQIFEDVAISASLTKYELGVGMGNDLKSLVEALVREGDAPPAAPPLPAAEVIESNSEEAWNDFQDSQLAYEKAFRESQQGSV